MISRFVAKRSSLNQRNDAQSVGIAIRLGCFGAGTPVLMDDGSEKPIENIQIAEIVLAWNVPPNTLCYWVQICFTAE